MCIRDNSVRVIILRLYNNNNNTTVAVHRTRAGVGHTRARRAHPSVRLGVAVVGGAARSRQTLLLLFIPTSGRHDRTTATILVLMLLLKLHYIILLRDPVSGLSHAHTFSIQVGLPVA